MTGNLTEILSRRKTNMVDRLTVDSSGISDGVLQPNVTVTIEVVV